MKGRAMTDDQQWLATAGPEWNHVEVPAEVVEHNFVTGDSSGRRLTLCYFLDGDGSVMVKVLLGADTQGPPGHVHGGAMASLLDETMGGTAWMNGHKVVAVELNVTFKRMLPVGTRCIIRSQVSGVDGRKIRVEATICDEQGTLYSSGRGLFITLDPSRFADMSEQAKAMPETPETTP
jgi:uncharacterized protein (TIGR00369 family)